MWGLAQGGVYLHTKFLRLQRIQTLAKFVNVLLAHKHKLLRNALDNLFAPHVFGAQRQVGAYGLACGW